MTYSIVARCPRTAQLGIDVRVDLHDKGATELRRVLEEFKRYRDYCKARCAHPGEAIPEEEFAAKLDAKAA